MSEKAYEIIDAYWAWEEGATGRDTRVAILDTGIDVRNHSARDHLLDQKGGGKDFTVENDFLDRDGHGTMMAGIVAATKMAGDPLHGVAPEARWFNARVIARSTGQPTVPILKSALEWSRGEGVKVVLMAITMPTQPSSVKALVGFIEEKLSNVLLVLSAGDLRDEPPPPQLSDLPNVVVVGAVGNEERYRSIPDPEVVHLAAPGQAVPSVGPKSRVRVTGSSAAAAFVAGAGALFFEKSPRRSAKTAKKKLLSSCRKVRDLKGKVASSGILNLPGLLDLHET